jgi:hypothetical protein
MKRLSVYVASIDVNGNPVKTPLANPFSIITDSAAKTTAVLDTFFAAITGFRLDQTQGILRAEFRLGGYDAGGHFCANPDFAPGAMTVLKVKNPAFWNANVANRTAWDFEALLPWLVGQKAIDRAASTVWGIAGLTGEIVTI